MTRTALALLFASTALVALDGCLTQECTLIGCGAPLVINLDGPGGEGLVEGPELYEIELDLDGALHRTECDFVGGELQCEELEGAEGFSVSHLGEYGSVWFEIFENGEERGPQRVGVRVISGGEVLVDESVEPVYEGTEINGEGCGFCYSASESFEVPDPTTA